MTLRIAALAVLLSLCAMAQTTVTDTIYLQPGTLWSGQITITWPAFTTASGRIVNAGTTVAVVNSGRLSVTLWPTAGATPSVAYAAHYLTIAGADRGLAWDDPPWNVPVSPSVVGLSAVRRPLVSSASADATSINGTTVPLNSAADQVIVTTAPSVAAWVSLADCTAAGRVLRYSTSAHAFSCAPLGTGDIPDLSAIYEPRDYTILRTSNFAGSGSAPTVAHSDHNHAGSYEPVDITILRQANFAGNGSALTVARSDHNHTGIYETASTNGGALAAGTFCMTVNGSGVKTWGACPAGGGGGGGGGALSWISLTNADWAAMTNSQWSSMTN